MEILPLIVAISPTAKSVVASLDVNVSNSDASFVVVPVVTPSAVIVIVGEVVSYVQVKYIDSMLSVEPSVYVVAPTYML